MITAIYREEDMSLRVEIVANLSDAQKEMYELRVLEAVQESRLYKSPATGEKFRVDQLRVWPNIWFLEEES